MRVVLSLVPVVISGLVAAGSLILGVVQGWRATRAARQAQSHVAPTIESRLQDVAASMSKASELLGLVQVEIEARAERAKQLAAQVEEGKRLASLNQGQIDAIAGLVRGQVAAEGKRSLWWTATISALFLCGRCRRNDSGHVTCASSQLVAAPQARVQP
jgi:hypothetical protein